MTPTSRPTARAAATAIVVSVLLGAVAVPAYAKTSITVAAVPIEVDTDSTIVVVTGSGADDAAGFQRICDAEAARSGPWRLVACSPVGYDYARTVCTAIPLESVAPHRFRAELFRVASPAGADPVLIAASPATLVNN